MVNRRTNKGQIIDLDSIMAQQKDIPAMGNMGVDAEGNTLGPGGEIVEGRDQRVRAYYKDNPQSSTAQQSLKGPTPTTSGKLTQKVKPDPVKQPEPEAPEGESFDEQEPLGYKEVELPNGDIEMVPYYTKEDAPDAKGKTKD
jgi:hypothetical protein